MAWEQRGGKRYFYRKRRVAGGGVVSEYVGCDLRAQLAALRAEEERRQQEAARETMRETRKNEGELDGHLDRAWAAIDELAEFCLAVAGYHRHRGEVRRRNTRRTGR